MNRNAQRLPEAFSLIEVVIALGIVSFAIVSLLGLIPVGLLAFRQSIDLTTQSQISQQIMSEAQLADWKGQGNTYTNQSKYFYDDQGYRTSATTASALYTVWITPKSIKLSSVGITPPPPSVATNLVVEIVNKMHPKTTNTVQMILFNPGKQN